MTPDSLPEIMARAARELQHQPSTEATVQAAVEIALDDIDGADAIGLSLITSGHQVQTLAATSAEARQADILQYQLAEGPCLDAVWKEQIVLSRDLRREDRWARWADQVSEATGFRSLMAVQLFTTTDRLGALNLYSSSVDAFDTTDRDHGLALAAHIAVAVRSAQQIQNLQVALDSRTVIAQAVGILMERYDLGAEGAFSVLTRVSTTTNTKLRDLATELCTTGRLPGVSGGQGSATG